MSKYTVKWSLFIIKKVHKFDYKIVWSKINVHGDLIDDYDFIKLIVPKKKIFVIYDLTNFVFLISRNNDAYICRAVTRTNRINYLTHKSRQEANLIFRAEFFFFWRLLPVKDKLSCVINEEKWHNNWPNTKIRLS